MREIISSFIIGVLYVLIAMRLISRAVENVNVTILGHNYKNKKIRTGDYNRLYTIIENNRVEHIRWTIRRYSRLRIM